MNPEQSNPQEVYQEVYQEIYVVQLPRDDNDFYTSYYAESAFTQKEHAEKWAKLKRGRLEGPLLLHNQDICPPQDSEELKKAKVIARLDFFLSREEIKLLGL
jgi:hypothetical protein